MAFKLRQPIKIDPVARYEVPFTPDNLPDNSGLVAKANDNGNMIYNKNIPQSSALYKEAKSHEDHHLRDIMDNKLAYDEEAVYHNMDGKGMKRTARSEFDESDENLAWEKPAYKAGRDREEKDMRPKKDKLNRAGEVAAGEFAFAFREIGKPMRKQDNDSVSMNENFGTSMVKKFGIGPQVNVEIGSDTDLSGNDELGPWGEWQDDPNNPKRQVRYRSGESTASSKPEYRVKAAISGGKAGAGYDATMIKMLEDGKTYEEIAAAGHGTAKGLRSRFEGKFTPPSTETTTVSEEEERFTKDPVTEIKKEKEEDPCPEGYFFSHRDNKCNKRSNLSGSRKKKNTSKKKLKQDLSKTTGDTEVCKVDDTPKEKKRKGCGYSKGDARRDARKNKPGKGGLY